MQEVNGNEYRVGCTYCVLYESSGISLDWAHGKVRNDFEILTFQLVILNLCNDIHELVLCFQSILIFI